MAELPRQTTDAAALADHVAMCVHSSNVRPYVRSVKGLDNVPAFCDHTYMSRGENIGVTLARLRARADLTLDEVAQRGGYARRSSVQEYFKEEYEGPLSEKAAAKLSRALTGLGNPPIMHDEITSLAGQRPSTNAVPVKFEGASLERLRDDLPVFGTALGAEMIVDGEAVEQTTLNTAEIIEYRKRPVISNGIERLYGLYVQGDSMYPAHREGSFLFVQREAPFKSGDDVVVYLRPRDERDDGETASQVLVKRFVRRTAQYIELEQFQPMLRFRLASEDVLRIDRVLTLDDIV